MDNMNKINILKTYKLSCYGFLKDETTTTAAKKKRREKEQMKEIEFDHRRPMRELAIRS